MIGRRSIRSLVLAALAVMSCSRAGATTFSVPERNLPKPLVFVAYGDMRFTDPQETEATNPHARRALVAKVAAERPAALFVSGDVPYHGIAADYRVFREETAVWRKRKLRVYPAIGNHELGACQVPACLERWWDAFPELRGMRWYSVALGARLVALALDSTSSLLPGSEQHEWLEKELAALKTSVRVVVVVIHHPPVADRQTSKLVDHNVRPNEEVVVDMLTQATLSSKVHFVVSAGHIHNYERSAKGGVIYLVSGGGGARPAEIDRTADDLYQRSEFPNFHYVRFELGARRLTAEMIRLEDAAAVHPKRWKVRDRFEISLPP